MSTQEARMLRDGLERLIVWLERSNHLSDPMALLENWDVPTADQQGYLSGLNEAAVYLRDLLASVEDIRGMRIEPMNSNPVPGSAGPVITYQPRYETPPVPEPSVRMERVRRTADALLKAHDRGYQLGLEDGARAAMQQGGAHGG